MAEVVIKQPDGRFSLFSTFALEFLFKDKTREEIETYFFKEAESNVRFRMMKEFEAVEDGKSEWTYEKALGVIKQAEDKIK